MEFCFQYKVKPKNLWLLSLLNIYRSMLGIINIVFTLSLILVAIRFWSEAEDYIKVLIALGILLFPLFQPVMILLRSRKIVEQMPDNMKMTFNKQEITITAGEEESHIPYSELKSIIRISGMLVLYTRSKQGFILNRNVLQNQGADLYQYLNRQVKK